MVGKYLFFCSPSLKHWVGARETPGPQNLFTSLPCPENVLLHFSPFTCFWGRNISWPCFCPKETMCVCVCVCVSVPALSCSVVSDSCDPIDCSLLDFSVYGILQARILEGVAISFSRGSSQLRNRAWVSSITSRHFTDWVMREALKETMDVIILWLLLFSHSVMFNSLQSHGL